MLEWVYSEAVFDFQPLKIQSRLIAFELPIILPVTTHWLPIKSALRGIVSSFIVLVPLSQVIRVVSNHTQELTVAPNNFAFQ